MIKTGYSKICITPPADTVICGYYEKRYTKGVLDDIYASAVAFDDGKKKALILTVELCLLSTAQSDKLRRSIADASGLDLDSILVNCSHTHTGPAVEVDLDGTPTDSEYDRTVYELMLKVSLDAFRDMRESSFFVGNGSAPGISFPRRFRMKNGGVQTNPGVENPDILHPLGEANDAVKFLKIERDGGRDIVIVCFGTHADTVGGDYISGDWPGFVCKTVEKVFENLDCVFITGAQGDVNHINTAPTPGQRRGLDYDSFDNVPRGYEHAKYMGRRVAGAVIGGLDKAEPIICNEITYASKKIWIPSNIENDRLDEAKAIVKLHNEGKDCELPYEKMELTTVVAEATRICKLENGPSEFDFVLSVLKLGDFIIAGLPGECFVEIGKRIEANYGKDEIMVSCLTNGGDGYFPTSSAYDEGGYEARSSKLKKGVDNIIVDKMTELIRGLQ